MLSSQALGQAGDYGEKLEAVLPAWAGASDNPPIKSHQQNSIVARNALNEVLRQVAMNLKGGREFHRRASTWWFNCIAASAT